MAFTEQDEGPIAAINVTPLVDVMLVLLVIFMVTAPMLQQGVEVNLPKTSTSAMKGAEEQIVLSIDKAGKFYLGAGNLVSSADLSKKAKAIMDSKPESERKIYVKADKEVDYGKVMEAMGELHKAEIFQIGLVTEKPDN